MKLRPSEPSRSENPAEKSPVGSKPAHRSRWVFRLAALVISPLLVFGVLEALLRLAGYGYPTAFFLPSKINGQNVLTDNAKFGWRFFGPALARSPYPTVLPAVKGPQTIRIFVLGESAAYGDPQPDFGLPRMLETLLSQRFAGVRFEVVNAAMTAINSNVILPIARDCAAQQGDIWVIYMGNNEVVGPFGSGTVFGPKVPPLALIRSSLALKATRTGELLSDLTQRLRNGANYEPDWRGMMMFVKAPVRQDDARMAKVYAHFQRNLDDILAVGREHGAKIVVSTVASNLKDCAPFASLHRSDLSSDELANWERLYQGAIEAEKGARMVEAISFYQQAAQIDEHFADLQFRWARCCLALGQEQEARKHFVLARDEDALRFRADSRINEIIGQRARGREGEGIYFVDGAGALEKQSAHGLIGQELLYEHVHMNFEGNYWLALALAEEVGKALPEAVRAKADSRRAWARLAECARQLAWSDWSRYETLRLLRIYDPPFTYQLNHAELCQHLRQELERLAPLSQGAALTGFVAEYRQAVARAPDDWVFWKNLGALLQRVGDLPAAIDAWHHVTDLLPQDASSRFERGVVLALHNQPEEAAEQFDIAMRLNPRFAASHIAQAYNDWGLSLAKQGKYQAALQQYEHALEIKPRFAEVQINLGVVLLAVGKTEEAREHFKNALLHKPTTPIGLTTLGTVCYNQGWFAEAITNYIESLRLDPTDPAVHVHLGEALAADGRFVEAYAQYAEAVRLKPDDAEARFGLGFELGRLGKNAEAIEEFSEAVRLKPDYAEAHLNWGITLHKQQKDQEAQRHFQEVLRLDPNNAVAKQYLKIIADR